MVTFDKNFCVLGSEGKISFGADYNLLTLNSAGHVVHNTESSEVTITVNSWLFVLLQSRRLEADG
ncbi:MAG: hypothetical protein MZV63_13935 [Marinilabiliales bacterium]|nr:hypothetical protein [Marinilabiliales bacterium]